MSDPVVTIRVRYENDQASLQKAGQDGARAIQEKVGAGGATSGSGGDVGGGGMAAAAAAMNPSNRPGSNNYTAQRALHNMLGGSAQDQAYVRAQRGETVGRLRDLIHQRNATSDLFNSGQMDLENFQHKSQENRKDYARERSFLDRTRADYRNLESRLGNQMQSAYSTQNQEKERHEADKERMAERANRNFDLTDFARHKANEKTAQDYRKLQYSTTEKISRDEARVAKRVDDNWDRAGLAQQKQQERLEAKQAVQESRQSAQHQGYRDLFHNTVSGLKSAEFEDGLLDMGPNAQRIALRKAAAAEQDPIAAMKMRRRATQLNGKAGLNTEVLSTGQFMNVLFGGMEIAHSMSAFQRAGNASSPQDAYAAYTKAADTVSGGFLGSFAGMAVGAEGMRADNESIVSSAAARDKYGEARASLGGMVKSMGREASLAGSFGAARDRKQNEFEKQDRDIAIRKSADAVVNAKREEQKLSRERIEEKYKSDLSNASYGGQGAGAYDEKATLRAGADRDRSLAALDEDLRVVRKSVEKQGRGASDAIYQAREREIRDSEFGRRGKLAAEMDYNYAGARGISASVAGRQRIVDEGNAASGAAQGFRAVQEVNEMTASKLSAFDFVRGQQLAEQRAGIAGSLSVVRANLSGNPDEARRRSLRVQQNERYNATDERLRAGLAPLAAGEAEMLDRNIENDNAMRTGGLQARGRVSRILANDTSPMRGIRANLAGITGSASLEAEGLARADRPGDAQRALNMGYDGVDGAKVDYMKGVSAVSGNARNVNLTGPGTTDLKRIEKQFEDAKATLGRMATKLDEIANKTGGATTSP